MASAKGQELRVYPDPVRAQTHYSQISDEQFGSWTWQAKNRIDSAELASKVFRLTEAERQGFADTQSLFRFAVTPYYALLANADDPLCPIRKQILPLPEEAEYQNSELSDPLGEEFHEAAPNLIHRYPDRALLLATDRCPVYCRFCTRRRIVGRVERQVNRELLSSAFAYLKSHEDIREVIISGGDALMLADGQIEFLLKALRAIPHIDIIRIATRMPVTCPMRITGGLAQMVSRYAPVYVMTHFNHAQECTQSAQSACGRFIDHGIPVYNQSVLLKGINDCVERIRTLNRCLVRMRVTPYYLHQCDLAQGIEHFRTPLDVGISIIDGLRGHMSGLSVPHFCVDVPGGKGKVTLQPDWVVRKNNGLTVLQTYQGKTSTYPDPGVDTHAIGP